MANSIRVYELARELDAILPEAFAVVKNACRRLYGKTIQVRGHDILWQMIPFFLISTVSFLNFIFTISPLLLKIKFES